MPRLLDHLGGNPVSDEFNVAVNLGRVPFWRGFRKFGMNNDVDTGTEYMWPPGSEVTYVSTPFVASISSSSIEDDTVKADTNPGSGAWTVRIEGLDDDWNEVQEDVTLNGTAAVTTTQTFERINRVYNLTAGTNGINVGNLSVTLDGNLQAYVEAGEGQSHQTFYSVPAGYYLVVTNYIITSGRLGNTDLAVLAEVRDSTVTDGAWRVISDIMVYESQYQNAASATVIPQYYDVRQIIVSNATNAECSSVFSGYLVDITKI